MLIDIITLLSPSRRSSISANKMLNLIIAYAFRRIIISEKKIYISLIIDCNLLISVMTLSDYHLLSFNRRRNHWNALIKQLLI